MLMDRIKGKLIGSRLEGLARRLYIRLDPTIWGQYDRLTLSILKHHLTPDSNCIDIGANRGSILREIIARAPHGQHFAFEPLPELAQYLSRTFPNVKVFPVALSNTPGQVEYTHVLQHPTRSSFKINNPNEPTEIITVKAERLDNLIPPDLPIRFIKLDVEGAEFQVLQGSVRTIRSNRPVIVFEHSDLAWRNYRIKSEQIYNLLTQECKLHISLLQNWNASPVPMQLLDIGCQQVVEHLQ